MDTQIRQMLRNGRTVNALRLSLYLTDSPHYTYRVMLMRALAFFHNKEATASIPGDVFAQNPHGKDTQHQARLIKKLIRAFGYGLVYAIADKNTHIKFFNRKKKTDADFASFFKRSLESKESKTKNYFLLDSYFLKLAQEHLHKNL